MKFGGTACYVCAVTSALHTRGTVTLISGQGVGVGRQTLKSQLLCGSLKPLALEMEQRAHSMQLEMDRFRL